MTSKTKTRNLRAQNIYEKSYTPSTKASSAHSTSRTSETTTRKSDYSSQVCTQIHYVLEQQIQPLFLEVSNITYRELQRRLLGTKLYWYRHVKQINHNGAKKWEVQLYEINYRKPSTNAKLNAMKSLTWSKLQALPPTDTHLNHLGYFDKEKIANKAYDTAVAKRNNQYPFGTNRDELSKELSRHLQIIIVAEVFHRLNQRERLSLVFEVILRCNFLSDTKEQLRLSLRRCTLYSYVGDTVLNLLQWQATTLYISVIAKTPTQYRIPLDINTIPLTERYGTSQLANDRSAAVRRSLLPPTHKLNDLINDNDELSKGQRLPHFYHGLPEDVKKMIAEDQVLQNALQSKSCLRNKVQVGTEATMLQNYQKRELNYIQAVRNMQRIFRLHMQFKIVRQICKNHRSAIHIQSVFRGFKARRYTRAIFWVKYYAVLHIQSVYRSHKSRKYVKLWKQQVIAATIALQRVYRGFLGRKYARWIRKLDHPAVNVQRGLRGFLARCRVRRIKLAKYRMCVLVPASVNIQRVWRGYKARLYVRQLQQEVYIEKVVLPATGMIVRIVRGYLARKQYKKERYKIRMACAIQTASRHYISRRRFARLIERRHRNNCASMIGAHIRGKLVRKKLQLDKRRQYEATVALPAIICIQRNYRGYIVRRHLQDSQDLHDAAVTLQQMWRKQKSLSLLKQKMMTFRHTIRDKRARTLQMAYKCYVARKQMRAKKLIQRGKYGPAALRIQSAWRSYKTRSRLAGFLFCAIIEKFARVFAKRKQEKDILEFDQYDAQTDLRRLMRYKKKLRRSIKELSLSRIEWERRQPFVEKELVNITDADRLRGWEVAFREEKHILKVGLELSVEDIEAKLIQLQQCNEDIEDLKLELEDLQRDYDECMLCETLDLQAYRDHEFRTIIKQYESDQAKKIAFQRSKWKVRAIRRNAICREQEEKVRNFIANDPRAVEALNKYYPTKENPAVGPGSLSLQTRRLHFQQFSKAIGNKLQQQIKETALNKNRQNKSINMCFENVVKKMKYLVNESIAEYNIQKTDLRDQENGPMCWGCGRIQCDCISRDHDENIHSKPSNALSTIKIPQLQVQIPKNNERTKTKRVASD